jgi:hypothetical protein
MTQTDKETLVYKIRRKSDGLYSGGGFSPRWGKTGKAWGSLGRLKNHLNLFVDYKGKISDSWPYNDAEVVTFKIVTEVAPTTENVFENFFRSKAKKLADEREKQYNRAVQRQEALAKLSKSDRDILGLDRWK